MAAKTQPEINLFDTTSFAAAMHSADDNPNVDEDVCPECREHMLFCECREELA